MNLCRTCKYWSCNSHAIGSGNCVNMDVQLRLLLTDGRIVTSQDFGCILHEEGPCDARVLGEEEHTRILCEFAKAVLR